MYQPNPRPGTQCVYPALMEFLESQAGVPGNAAHSVMPYLAGLIKTRVEEGLQKYGTMLETNNGRDAIVDAWMESIDLCFYLKQAVMEGDDVQWLLDREGRNLFELTRLVRKIQSRDEVPA